MANILYRKQKQQKSLDNGVTWIDTGEYRVGDILENPSNCISDDSKQCRWVELDASEGYYCDGYTKYTVQVEECTENGIIWTRTGVQKRGNSEIESYATDCGFVYNTNYGNIKYLTNDSNSRINFNDYQIEYMNITDYGNGMYLATENVDSLLLKYNQNVFNSTNLMFFGNNGGSTNYCNPIEFIELPDTSDVIDMSWMFDRCTLLTTLNLNNFNLFNTSNVTDMNNMFNYCSGLTSLNVSNFDTSNVTDMHHMFSNCESLTSLDLSNFNTSNVTNMSWMFSNCESLTSLNVSNFNTSNVGVDDNGDGSRDFSWMFYNCSNLTSLDVSSFDTSNSRDMAYMFSSCSGLTSLNVSNFDTSNVTDMDHMFSNCSNLTSLDLSNFNTSNEIDISYMFYNCSNLTSLDLSNWNFENVTDSYNMLYGCNNLRNVNLSNCILKKDMSRFFEGFEYLDNVNFSNVNTSNVTHIAYMFNYCSSLTSLDLSSFDTSNVTYMEGIFKDCNSLTSIDVSGWDIDNVLTDEYYYMFENCTSLEELILGNVEQYEYDWWCSQLSKENISCDIIVSNITKQSEISFTFEVSNTLNSSKTIFKLNETDYSATTANSIDNGDGTYTYTATLGELNIDLLTSCKSTFSYDSSYGYAIIKEINNFPDTSNVTDMSYMFNNCSGLTSLDLSSWNVNSVITMWYMFWNCKSLTTLNLSNWNTSNVTIMEGMFADCYSLTSLDVSSFDTSKVTTMVGMFDNCSGLTEVDLSNFNTSNLTAMNGMFDGCRSLIYLDLSNFDTSKTTQMLNMFRDCTSLTSLNLSNWDMSNVTINNNDYMFYNSNNLTTIYCYNCNQTTIDKLNSVKPSNCTLVY